MTRTTGTCRPSRAFTPWKAAVLGTVGGCRRHPKCLSHPETTTWVRPLLILSFAHVLSLPTTSSQPSNVSSHFDHLIFKVHSMKPQKVTTATM